MHSCSNVPGMLHIHYCHVLFLCAQCFGQDFCLFYFQAFVPFSKLMTRVPGSAFASSFPAFLFSLLYLIKLRDQKGNPLGQRTPHDQTYGGAATAFRGSGGLKPRTPPPPSPGYAPALWACKTSRHSHRTLWAVPTKLSGHFQARRILRVIPIRVIPISP